MVTLSSSGMDRAIRLVNTYRHLGCKDLWQSSRISRLAAFTWIAIQESLENSGFTTKGIIIPAGEQYKNMETVQVIWDQMLAAGLERGSTVLAVGGGVVTDMAGFAAATFLRGVSWVACPTSLLGMVDASLGGKTGVDLPQGKNLVGAFYPPKMVIVDPEMLATLPDVELKNGMAEVLKHGIISNAAIVDLCLEKNWKEDVPAMIPTIMFAKIQVINADPYEKGIRATLNLGHTIGHAIELESGFSHPSWGSDWPGYAGRNRYCAEVGVMPYRVARYYFSGFAEFGFTCQIVPND